MTRRITFLAILLISVVTHAAPPLPLDAEAAGGIVYGQTWAFMVTSHAGWSMTRQSGLPVSTAFFQVHSTEPSSVKPPTFMYITVTTVDIETPSLTELQQQDESDFREESKELMVSQGSVLTAADKQPVIVRRFDNTRDGGSEFVAYHRGSLDLWGLNRQ
jgi:hypothetical protein